MKRRTDTPARHQPRPVTQPTVTAPPSPAATSVPTPPRATVVDVPAASGLRTRPGDRGHTVLAGESLWAVASDLLGGSASPASVAREVQRLWQLNRDRIGTGDPDLLHVGTRLVLR